MDLRQIINTEAGDNSVSKQATLAPVTPVQTHPSQGFRDYSHPPQASPGKHLAQDYAAQPGGHYVSPTTYQGNNYPGRPPPPPPIQASPQNELRSPARSYAAQSPYQHTPSSAASTSQYPFPQTHQTPQSPAQHHQYPPSLQQRESFPQPNPPPHLQHQNSYGQGSPAPQTPPVGIPGHTHPYLQHQRSQSSISNSTPTSAHSQYFNQYSQDSPVSTTHFPPSQLPQHQRQQSQHSQHSQQSQPGTPLGPPLTQRGSSGAFPQPSSPYQQRGLSSSSFPNFQQTSPAPPPPATIPRQPSTPSAYDSHRTSTSDQQRRSQSERERSLSVSPKTRLPSQPIGEITTPQSENDYIHSSKRKMEDREVSVEEQSRRESHEFKPQVNGDYRIPSTSPQQPPKKRVRYTEPPIWARSVRNKGTFGLANRGPSKLNGKLPVAVFQPQTAPSPAVNAQINGDRQASPAATRSGPPPMDAQHPLLGRWEQSITGNKPFDMMTKLVADFLYTNVVSRSDLGELGSRGVEIEIEAKLGQLIDRETNDRYQLPVLSECILNGNARVGFKSSMTEDQHKTLNNFLNQRVAETHPNNPQSKKRVQIDYLHRRETDKFYELPPSMHGSLPAAVREKLNPRHAVKVRVTHDQKSNQVLAKIIKARITDLDIYNPQSKLDCRISINFEMKYDGDIEDIIASGIGERIPDRNKDRLSYTQSHYQIDLTQVTQTTSVNGVNRTEKEHELEIEVSTAAIQEQGQRAAAGQAEGYLALVEGFLDNYRVLSRYAEPGVP